MKINIKHSLSHSKLNLKWLILTLSDSLTHFSDIRDSLNRFKVIITTK